MHRYALVMHRYELVMHCQSTKQAPVLRRNKTRPRVEQIARCPRL